MGLRALKRCSREAAYARPSGAGSSSALCAVERVGGEESAV